MANSVRDAMTESPRSIGASASVVEAARLMREEHIGSLSRREVWNLIFQPGFSTRKDVSEMSGRGVGLDAVKEFLTKDGGSIRIHLLGNDSQEPCPFETVITLPDKYAASLNANISFDALISQNRNSVSSFTGSTQVGRGGEMVHRHVLGRHVGHLPGRLGAGRDRLLQLRRRHVDERRGGLRRLPVAGRVRRE